MTIAHSSIPTGMRAEPAAPPLESFRAAEEAVALDWPRLQGYLRSQGHDLNLQFAPRQFASGLGNLNYLVEIDAQHYVLRRPPLGLIPPGANDMAREHRVLSKLWTHFPYAPGSLLYCADPSVLGAHFLIMEYRPGLTIGSQLPADMDAPIVGPKIAATLVQLLAQLHSIDAADVGLEHLGKPAGFLERAIEGWASRANLATEARPQPVITELVNWLRRNRVPDGAPTLLHCDFKLDNVVLDPRTLDPRAVLDWDMSTRGDPLFDLATLLSYWTEEGDPPALHALRQMPTAQQGFPTRQEIVRAYASATGRDVSDFRFHRVLAMFKLAVVFLQLYARYRAGTTQDERFEEFERLGHGILDFTHAIAHGRGF
jgi:aminoglycoside phosphotransferase (APT) family kinase protein